MKRGIYLEFCLNFNISNDLWLNEEIGHWQTGGAM